MLWMDGGGCCEAGVNCYRSHNIPVALFVTHSSSIKLSGSWLSCLLQSRRLNCLWDNVPHVKTTSCLCLWTSELGSLGVSLGAGKWFKDTVQLPVSLLLYFDEVYKFLELLLSIMLVVRVFPRKNLSERNDLYSLSSRGTVARRVMLGGTQQASRFTWC